MICSDIKKEKKDAKDIQLYTSIKEWKPIPRFFNYWRVCYQKRLFNNWKVAILF